MVNQNEALPIGNRNQLLQYITEVSFAAYDAALYLDTHPNCEETLFYYREMVQKRNYALNEYARLYGPLKFSQIPDEKCKEWKWANQKWPWEGGKC